MTRSTQPSQQATDERNGLDSDKVDNAAMWVTLLEKSYFYVGGAPAYCDLLLHTWMQMQTVSGILAAFIFTAVLATPEFEERPLGPSIAWLPIQSRRSLYAYFIIGSFCLALWSCFCGLVFTVFWTIVKSDGRYLAELLMNINVVVTEDQSLNISELSKAELPPLTHNFKRISRFDSRLSLSYPQGEAWPEPPAGSQSHVAGVSDSESRLCKVTLVIIAHNDPRIRRLSWSMPAVLNWFRRSVLFNIPAAFLSLALLFMMFAVGIAVGGIFPNDGVSDFMGWLSVILNLLLIMIGYKCWKCVAIILDYKKRLQSRTMAQWTALAKRYLDPTTAAGLEKNIVYMRGAKQELLLPNLAGKVNLLGVFPGDKSETDSEEKTEKKEKASSKSAAAPSSSSEIHEHVRIVIRVKPEATDIFDAVAELKAGSTLGHPHTQQESKTGNTVPTVAETYESAHRDPGSVNVDPDPAPNLLKANPAYIHVDSD